MLPSQEIPLSFAQRQLWFLEQLSPGEAGYNLLDGVRIRGAFDIDLLERCVRQLTQRHESLRSSFRSVDGQPLQVIAEHVDTSIFRFDLRGMSEVDRLDEAKRIADQEGTRSIDLTHAPLWRLSVIQLGDEECWVLLTIHHIVFDGWSAGIFWTELVESYQAAALGLPAALAGLPSGQVSDFVKWEIDHLQGEFLENLTRYWRQQLDGAPSFLALPADFARPARPSHRGAKASLEISSGLAGGLRELARKQHATLFITLLSAYKVFLFRYTNQDDLTVGTPFACRSRPNHEGIIGFLVNTLVLRSRLNPELSFLDFMREVRATSVAAYDHGDLPFSSLVEAVGPERDVSYNPLFQTMFQMNEQPPIHAHKIGLVIDPLRLEAHTSNFDLTMEIIDEPGKLVLTLEYATDLFRRDTIERLLRNYEVLLEQIAADPRRRIGDLQTMTSAERTQLVESWSRAAFATCRSGDVNLNISVKGGGGGLTLGLPDRGIEVPSGEVVSVLEQLASQLRCSQTTSHCAPTQWKCSGTEGGPAYGSDPREACLHQFFEEQVRQVPDQIAVCHEDLSLSYAELNGKANQLAYELMERGVGPEVVVGICLERSLDMIVAMLAVLKAGGAYLPLDPGYPVDRLRFMFEDAGALVLVCRSDMRERLAIDEDAILCLAGERLRLEERSRINPQLQIDPSSLAYIIYTSGSTGKPKGVAIEHRSASSFVRAAIANYGITPADCVLQFGSISFDLAVEEIFACLSAGGRLQLRTDEMLSNPTRFLECCQTWGITILDLPTAYWHQLISDMAHTGSRFPAGVRLVIIGGERVLPAVVGTWRRLVGDYPKLFNSYGPTEATVVATGHWVGCDSQFRSEVPIGRPLANAEVYVLDSRRQPVPIGAPGELYIGGRSLARGYLNRPGLTAQSFVTVSLKPGTSLRLYRSGDRVRFLHDGNLEFLGRMDNQVKIRGFRIELGEIESALLRYPGVRETVVVPQQDGAGSQRLNAYVVPQAGEAVPIQGVRAYLRQSLPGYMVPSSVVSLSSIPLTPNGKVDIRALPSPNEASAAVDDKGGSSSGGPVEERLMAIWAGVLNVPKLGIQDRFFDLGGHSLQAVQIMTRIRREFGVDLPLSALFQSPSVEEMSARLGSKETAATWSPLVAFQPSGTKSPFFAIHGGHGEVLFYKSLSEHLGVDQPFYALRAKGNDFPGMPHQSVEEMARSYLQAVRAIQPRGPYRIGGASFGGIVAFEMAQQLDAAGEGIEALVLFDTGGFREFTRALPLTRRIVNLIRCIPRYGLKETWHRLRVRVLRFVASDSVVEFYRATGSLPKESSEAISTWEAVWKANLVAADCYVPKEYSGAITLIRARDDGNHMWFDCDQNYGWDGYARGGIAGYDVPGTHIGMFQEPYVKELARTMSQILDSGGLK